MHLGTGDVNVSPKLGESKLLMLRGQNFPLCGPLLSLCICRTRHPILRNVMLIERGNPVKDCEVHYLSTKKEKSHILWTKTVLKFPDFFLIPDTTIVQEIFHFSSIYH